MATKPTTPDESITGESQILLDRIMDVRIDVPIVGYSPLIPHKWSEKARGMMREKQTSGPGAARTAKTAKNPTEDAEDSCYWLPDGRPGMPATAFKSAIVEASRYFEGVTMTALKRIIFVEGVGPDMLVPIVTPTDPETGEPRKPRMREDTPRNSGGTADLRYRYMFEDWSAVLSVRFVPQVIPGKSIFVLVDAAGRGGVGDWRPGSPKSNTGIYGTFRVHEDKLGGLL
jgi:hypothetical protein